MSLPSGGSTAPPITSPFLAWPSKPASRSSPLSTPSDEVFGTLPASTSYGSMYSRHDGGSPSSSPGHVRRPSLKGKERATNAPEVRVVGTGGVGIEGEEHYEEQAEKHYAPPKRPLTPHQLGRIAQSFGIVIPTLPQLSTPTSPTSKQRPLSPGAASGRDPTSRGRLSPMLGASPPNRPSAYLLSVIPPLSLLDPSSSLSPEQTLQRARKWRRGRLLSLQPTLRSMLVSIAREYGLPSTAGIGVYLVLPTSSLSKGDSFSSAASSTWSLSEHDEPSGPQISSSTWSTLFAAQLMNPGGISTRSSTPSTTPIKGAATLTRDISYPPSPLSLVGKESSRPGHKAKVRSLSSGLTPTKAPSTHSSNPSTSTASSNLPPTPASLGPPPSAPVSPNPIVGTIEFDIDLEEATWYEDWRRSGGASRHKRSLTGEGGIKELSLVRKVKDERPRFLRELDVNRPTPERKRISVHGNGAMSNSASFYGFEGEDAGNITVESEPNMRNAGMLDTSASDDLLASPVNLEFLHADSALAEHKVLKHIQEALDKRGSGYVMSDQLDDLEKIMRQLSPRDIRLTSPRMLTPRMAAKVASMPLELPAVPRQNAKKSINSPLAGAISSPDLHATPDAANLEKDQGVDFAPPRPAWPAVPHGSPGSPIAVQDYFAHQQVRVPVQRNVSSPAVISAETQKRMQEATAESAGKPATGSEWIPRRPARPPSPRLPHQRTLSHTLSPELVGHLLRSPPAATGMSGNDPISPPPLSTEERRHKSRQASIGFKGLRHQMSGKNLNGLWRGSDKDKAEPVGLFPSGVEAEKSSFPGLREGLGQRSVSGPAQSQSQTSEFGALPVESETTAANGSLPSKSGKFASRIFHPSFGFRRNDDSSKNASKSRRQPSVDGPVQISAPITSTFKHGQGASGMPNAENASNDRLTSHHTSPAMSASPNPASPRSVRRKPVPGGAVDGEAMRPSESLASMASFVLEDPPKGKRAQVGLGFAV